MLVHKSYQEEVQEFKIFSHVKVIYIKSLERTNLLKEMHQNSPQIEPMASQPNHTRPQIRRITHKEKGHTRPKNSDHDQSYIDGGVKPIPTNKS